MSDVWKVLGIWYTFTPPDYISTPFWPDFHHCPRYTGMLLHQCQGVILQKASYCSGRSVIVLASTDIWCTLFRWYYISIGLSCKAYAWNSMQHAMHKIQEHLLGSSTCNNTSHTNMSSNPCKSNLLLLLCRLHCGSFLLKSGILLQKWYTFEECHFTMLQRQHFWGILT